MLGTLDDKINLNQKIIETLETMARALFKSWFVDFDPARAKAEGRDPGLPARIAMLFPDSFEDSELGEIPKGWEIAALGENFEPVKGLSYKGSGLADSGLPMHNLNSIYEGGGYKYEGIKHYTGEYRERHLIAPGDLIVANTEQGHDKLLIGYAAIVPESIGQIGIFTHHLYRVRPRAGTRFTSRYLCYLLNTSQMHDTVAGYTNGTTVNGLSIDGLQLPLIVCPPEPLVQAFDNLASLLSSRCELAINENRTLIQTRDSLLPKLISGEIRVAGGVGSEVCVGT